jgi:hypothetical protein
VFNLLRESTLDTYTFQEENIDAEGGGVQYNIHRGFNQGNR